MTFPLYLDEDGMDRDLVRALRAHQVDVITALEAGMLNRDDADHLAIASTQGRALFSYNASDYYRIHTELLTAGESHAGLILAPQQRYSIGEQVRRLLALISARTPEEMRDQAEFLSSW